MYFETTQLQMGTNVMSRQTKWSCIYYFFFIVYSSFLIHNDPVLPFQGKGINNGFFLFWGAQLQKRFNITSIPSDYLECIENLTSRCFFLSFFLCLLCQNKQKDPEEDKVQTSQAVENTWKILSQPRMQSARCRKQLVTHRYPFTPTHTSALGTYQTVDCTDLNRFL